MLGEVANSLEELVTEQVLSDEEEVDQADGFRNKLGDILEPILEDFKDRLSDNEEKETS